MDPIKILYFVVGFVVFMVGFRYFSIVKNLLNFRFRRPSGELKEREDLPGYLEELLPWYENKLAELGFEFSQLYLIDSCIVASQSQSWNLVYYNEESGCYAELVVKPMPEAYEPVGVAFSSDFSDETHLATSSGMETDIIGELPNTILHFPRPVTIEEQYKTHLEKLKSLGREGIWLSPEESLTRGTKDSNDYIEWLIDNGYLKAQDEFSWQLRLKMAMKQAFKVIRVAGKWRTLKAAQRKVRGEQGMVVEVPIEAEVDAYLSMEELTEKRKSGFGWKLLVFVASLALGIAIFGGAFSFDFALSLAAALIVHELGHYLAMLVFGYRDRQILFLPFGAATLGKKKGASAIQQAVVFLAGPGLGLIVGSVCMLLALKLHYRPLFFSGAFFLVLNYINLLPIVPLDGGRLFELALFGRVPVMKSVFLVLSLAAVVLAGILLKDTIIGFFAIFMFMGMKRRFSINSFHAQLAKEIKHGRIEAEKEVLLGEVFGWLKEKEFAKLPFAEKYKIADELVSELMRKPCGVGTSVAALGLYVFVVVLPVLIMVGTLLYWGVLGRLMERFSAGEGFKPGKKL
ncbi:MAG: site-2 protease family protein [Sedimentisphaerales bacterium]|nr:site-2 protease family protein [Sedimentisphaerales bacterium]